MGLAENGNGVTAQNLYPIPVDVYPFPYSSHLECLIIFMIISHN